MLALAFSTYLENRGAVRQYRIMNSPSSIPNVPGHALRALVDVCSPEPLRGDDVERLAVDRDDVPDVFRPDVRAIEHVRFFGNKHPKILLFGSLGSGKSTELSRIDQALGHKFLIVGLDLGGQDIKRGQLNAMTAEELIMLCGLAIAEAADRVAGVQGWRRDKSHREGRTTAGA